MRRTSRLAAWTALFSLFSLCACTTMADAPAPTPDDDPFRWLEDVQGERALGWVRERNAQSQQLLEARPEFAPLRARLREVLDAKDRIPYVRRLGPFLYNFWQDEAHKRGLWRRTTLDEYRKPQPAWETVLDLDALAAAENENWVWGGADCVGPQYRRCLVSLSRGGADAKVVREFDAVAKAFVKGGFELPEAKSEVHWFDGDTLIVGTDFGPGSLTDSGYPRVIKRWHRGMPLASATTLFEAQRSDVAASAWVDRTPGFERLWLRRSSDFYHDHWQRLEGDTLLPFDVPSDANIGLMHSAGVAGDTLLIELRSPLDAGGRSYPRGALLAADLPSYLKGERRFTVLFEPTPTRSLASFTTTRTHVILNVLDNVTSRLEEWKRDGERFTRRVIDAPAPGALSVGALHDPLLRDDPLAEHYTLNYADFLTPDALLLGRTGSDARTTLKSLPPTYDATGLKTTQHLATSRDGTKVPYFVVGPADLKLDGSAPTMLYGYGGYRVSLAPWYPRAWGPAWLARRGVFVVANIRGGGEFGPAWHDAATKANKQKSYDDFIAVAEDLIARKVTSPRHLGIQGGSNGGLLVGAVAMQRPELFNAVVCQVPLLDMKRYHRLLAGASWMAEYGNPDDPAEWAFISKYSPYQNVRPDRRYPRMLLTTSTRDDRVHPGHARKMTARLMAQGHPVLYYENIEGGHGLAADNEQRAHVLALEFSYAWMQLGR